MKKPIPGPAGGPFGLRLASQMRRDPLRTLTSIGHRYGDIAYFRLGPFPIYLLNHPDLIREALLTRARSLRKQSRFNELLKKVDGDGLITSEGELWQRQRRLLQPAFQFTRLPRYLDAMRVRTERTLDGWKDGDERDFAAEMTHLTLAIIAKSLFDLELEDEVAALGAAVHTLSETLVAESGAIWPRPAWWPGTWARRRRRAVGMLDRFVWEVIRRRRASGEDKGDLISILLLAADEQGDGKGMSDRQVRDEAVTLFNAGHDTTAAALAWAGFLLGAHPEAQERIAREVEGIGGGRVPGFEDLGKLAYTEAVILETMRLYPPAWLLFVREPTETIQVGGHTLRKGSWIYASPYVTQRDPRFFAEPSCFEPERFLPPRKEKLASQAYFPFGVGPHFCIGNQFAIMEMKLILSLLIRRFRLSLRIAPEQVREEALISLRPLGGLPVILHER